MHEISHTVCAFFSLFLAQISAPVCENQIPNWYLNFKKCMQMCMTDDAEIERVFNECIVSKEISASITFYEICKLEITLIDHRNTYKI